MQYIGYPAFMRYAGLLDHHIEIFHGKLFWSQRPMLTPTLVQTNRFFREPAHLLSTDARGFRTTVGSQTGGTSVLCLGDSEMFGVGVDNEHTFPSLLAGMLNKDSSQNRFNVMNLGVSGYDTQREYLTLLRQSPPREPSWVVVQFNINDNWIPMEAFRHWELPLFRLKAYLLFRLLTLRLPSELEIADRGFEKNRHDMEKIQQLCRQRNARLIVYHVNPAPRALDRFPSSPDYFLDLSGELSDPNAYRNRVKGSGFGHLNAAGHRLCADAVSRILLSTQNSQPAGVMP